MNNFVKRTLVGILFVAVMVFFLTFDRICFFCLFWALMVGAMREFYNMSMGDDMGPQRAMAYIAALTAFCADYFLHCVPEVSALTIKILWGVSLYFCLLIPVTCVFKPDIERFSNIAYVYAGLLYIAVPVILSPRLVMDGPIYDGWMFLSLFIIIWMSDVGAYCVGTALGQKPNSKKLAPLISPKKSWWGFGGAVVLGVGTAIGLHYLTWLPFSLIDCIVVGVFISLGSVCGDLVESMWKRHFKVKDSGNAIPGHGGLLDRFDSSLIAIPLACIYLSMRGLI